MVKNGQVWSYLPSSYWFLTKAYASLSFMYIAVWSACISAPLVCLVPTEARRGHQIPWD